MSEAFMGKGRDRTARLPQRIKKQRPFDLSAIREDYPTISILLAQTVRTLAELPDFSDDEKVAVMSDFGGEHKGSRFTTYSFLLMAYDKVGPFEEQTRALREKYDLLDPYSEFSFKDLTYGPRSRALDEFLWIVDHFIHGAVITIAIDRQIETVFGPSKKEAHTFLVDQLAAMGLGQWKGPVAEKVLRVCHSIAFFVGLTTRENQRLLWYCDNDAINEMTKTRNFGDTQKIFQQALAMYAKHSFDLVGFGKSFDGKSHLDDLLSIPDLAAGVVQDVLKAHAIGDDNIPGGHEKISLVKWLTTESQFLSKITIQISKLENGEIGCGLVNFGPAIHE
jgi:hypothetical protein